MKKGMALLLAGFLLLLGAGCGVPSSEREPGRTSGTVSRGESVLGETYCFEEAEFLEGYEKALEQGDSAPAAPAPQDPADTGFAVVPLDRDLYGISAYAFLPLQERMLTEEEFLQLARGMGGLSGRELLSPERARTGLSAYDGTDALFANRMVTRREEAALLRLTPRYFYEGKRASSSVFDRQAAGLPVTVELGGGDKFAVLPEGDMSEEGLLRYLEVKYSRLNPEDYLPLPEEIPYEELSEHLSAELLRYGVGDGPLPEFCALLQSSGTQRAPEERSPAEETWQVTLLYPEGDEYIVGLRSETGELYGWARYPNGTFTAGMAEPPSHAGNLGEEELGKKAAAYLKELYPGDAVEISGMTWQGERSTYFEETGKCIWAELGNGGSVELTLLPDGTIQNFYLM